MHVGQSMAANLRDTGGSGEGVGVGGKGWGVGWGGVGVGEADIVFRVEQKELMNCKYVVVRELKQITMGRSLCLASWSCAPCYKTYMHACTQLFISDSSNGKQSGELVTGVMVKTH